MMTSRQNNMTSQLLVCVELFGACAGEGDFFVGCHGDGVLGWRWGLVRWRHGDSFRLLGWWLRGNDVIIVFEILLRESSGLRGYGIAFIWFLTVNILILVFLWHLRLALSAAVVEAAATTAAAAAPSYQAAEYSQELCKW